MRLFVQDIWLGVALREVPRSDLVAQMSEAARAGP